MDRNRNRGANNSDEGGQGNGEGWDDWFHQFDPDQTRPMPQVPADDPYADQDQAGYRGSVYPEPRRDSGRWERIRDESPPPPRNQRQPQQPPRSSITPSWAQPEVLRGLPPAPPAPPTPPNRRTAAAGQPPSGTPPGRTLPRKRPNRARRVVLGVLTAFIVISCAFISISWLRLSPVYNDVFVDSGRPTQTISITERRNILLMGLDTRSAEDSRSDTMILITIDPATKTAGMLSVPRDLWVNIPDFEGQSFGENRINSAYQFGKNTGVENGGPLLVKETFEQNFGVRVDNWVEVNFAGFRSIVDSLGGVTVDVPRPLIDNEYPADYGFAYQRIYIPSGIQHLDGRTALQYVRSRHADSDLGRNQRQQAVLLALKEQALNLNILPKLNDLIGEITGTVKTNLSLQEVAALGGLARDIQRDKIQNIAIDENMTTQTNVNGAEVLMPNWEIIRPAVRQLVANPVLLAEKAAIVVQNGTDTPGLATKNRDLLTKGGLNVIGIGNPADGGGGRYPTSIIYDYSGGAKPETIAEIRKLLAIDGSNVRAGESATRPEGADIMVMIGEDKAK